MIEIENAVKRGRAAGWRKAEGVRDRRTLRAYPDEWELIVKFANLIKKGDRQTCEKFIDKFS